jgi:hypothetical protein
MHKLLPVLAAVFATGALGAMYNEPYALVERGMTSDARKEVALAITAVDGKAVRDPRRTDPITPGEHTISVRFQSMRYTFRPEQQDVELDLEACVRYRVVAHYEIKSGPNWKPKVYSEPIGECRKRFASKGAAAK